MILSSLKLVSQHLLKKYGPETALIGKVAISAFLPGAGVLVEKGFEALFDYISDHHERIHDLPLVEGINQEDFAHLLSKLDQAEVFTQIELLKKKGLNHQQIHIQILAQIQVNVQFKELKMDFEKMNQNFQAVHQKLDQIQTGMHVMIKGQAIQEESLKQMIALLTQISGKIMYQPNQIDQKAIQEIPEKASFDLMAKFKEKTQQDKMQQDKTQKLNQYEIILDQINGNQIQIIQYLCNELKYELTDAIMTINQLPKAIYVTDQQGEILKVMCDLIDLGGIVRQRILKFK